MRFAGKYRILGGAGSDAHVAQGLGAVRIPMRDFDGPEEFLESLRDADILARPSSLRYAQVQALKFLETQATPPAARRASRRARVAAPSRAATRNDRCRGKENSGGASNPVGGMPATDDEIREKYLERAIRELNHFTRELQACDRCPRGNLMPVLGSGHPQADVFLLKHAPDARGDRGGRRLLRPRGHGADEVAQAARHRPTGRLRHAVREVPGDGHGARRARVRRAAGRGDRDRPAQDRRGHGAGGARRAQRARSCRWRARSSRRRARSSR